MSEYKYPWVPREYFAAMMGALKMIQDTGHFNKAVNYYSGKYNVDPNTLVKYIKERQGIEQKDKPEVKESKAPEQGLIARNAKLESGVAALQKELADLRRYCEKEDDEQ